MPQQSDYFLWVRIVDLSRPVKGTVGSDDLQPTAGDKRPKKRSVLPPKGSPQVNFDGVESYFGIDDVHMDLEYGRAFADEKSAVEWLTTTTEGKAWNDGCVNRFLLTSTVIA